MTLILLSLILLGEPVTMTYAAGYIPNIQFAPFYIAQERGYYEEEGIVLKMDYTIGPDVFKLTALGKADIASADPDAFLLAVSRGMPLVHVATLYQNYPVGLIAKSDILDPENLKSRRLGISGTYGSSYLGLKAMLAEMNLSLTDIRLMSIGFTQSAALKQGRVDAVVGYLNNDAVRLEASGETIFTRSLSGGAALPGVGLMVSQSFLEKHPDKVAGFLRATFKGVRDIVADPETCFQRVVEKVLPELKSGDNAKTELAVLKATIPYWHNAWVEENGYGQTHPRLWKNLLNALSAAGHQNLEGGAVDFGFTWNP